MAMGYCPACDKLVPIERRLRTLASKIPGWFPVRHDNRDERPCEGHQREIK